MLLHVGLSVVLCNLNIMASRVDEVDSVLTESRPAVDQLLHSFTLYKHKLNSFTKTFINALAIVCRYKTTIKHIQRFSKKIKINTSVPNEMQI